MLSKLTDKGCSGVREYWIIDPLKQAIIVCNMEHDDGPALYSFNNIIKANIYDDLEILKG